MRKKMEKRKKQKRNELHVSIIWIGLILLALMLNPSGWIKILMYGLLIISIINVIYELYKRNKINKNKIDKLYLALFYLMITSLIFSFLSIVWLTIPSEDSIRILTKTRNGRIQWKTIQPQYKINTMINSIIVSSIILSFYITISLKYKRKDAIQLQQNIENMVKKHENKHR